MYTMAVCHHDTETEEDRKRWLSFALILEKIIGEKIEIAFFDDFFQEEEALFSSRSFDLYYASPIVGYKLYKKGYKPIAKFKGSFDTFCVVGSKKGTLLGKTPLRISSFHMETYIFPLLFLENFDLVTADVKLVSTQAEVLRRLEKGEADIGILYENTCEKIKNLSIIKKIETSFYHLFMASPTVAAKFSKAFTSLPDTEKVDTALFLKSLHIDLPISSILKIKEFFDISKTIFQVPFITTLIYKNIGEEKIVFASDSLCRTLDYSCKELQRMAPADIMDKEDREKIEKIFQSETPLVRQPRIRLRGKNGKIRYAYVFFKTITYQESTAKFIFFVDITNEVRLQRLYHVLREINQAIITVLDEETLYKTIISALLKELGIKFAWIGVLDEKRGLFKAIFEKGEQKGYLKDIQIAVNEELPEGRGPTANAYRLGKISINPDTSTNPVMAPFKDAMLKRGFLSSAAIPIRKKGKVVAVLNIYADEPDFFNKLTRTLLEELQKDLGFALEKISTIQNSILIKTALERSDEWVLMTDQDGKIIYINDYVAKKSGYKKKEILGQKPSLFKSGIHPRKFYRALHNTLEKGEDFESVFANRTKNGTIFYLEEKIIPIHIQKRRYFIAIGRDITSQKALYEEVEYLKHHDLLTGLYNFNGFSFKVSESLPNTKRALLAIIDIKNFTYINKTYGIETGDQILKLYAQRLREYFKKDDILAKVGSDEFAIFTPHLSSKEDIFIIKERIEELFTKPYTIHKHHLSLFANIGISYFPDDGSSFSKLYENASTALHYAKTLGSGKTAFFNKELEREAAFYMNAEKLIEKAVEEGFFIFHYQPYFHTENKKLAGFEALVRIRENGTIHYPGEFIEYLEESPLLDNFREWAFDTVIDTINRWQIPVSINLSGKSFLKKDLLSQIQKYLEKLKTDTPLTIEITERALIEDAKYAISILNALKERFKNVKIAIDDFGTGHSSLSYLKDFNADILKIDISFVRAMMEDERSKMLVKGIIDIAESLGMKTLAEGVETEEQFEILRDFGCNYIQGYLLGKPMPKERAEELIREQNGQEG
ncbi:EAL domain-containing protein [Hydrogenimonas sp.]